MSGTIRLPDASVRPSGKLEAFEGIRGLASFGVLCAHLIIGFWPILYTKGHPWMERYPSWVAWMANSPLRVLFDGQFAVSLFFILSGFVLSIAYFRKPSPDTIASTAVRRYPRLMVPAAVSVLIGYAFMKLGWMHNLSAVKLMDQSLGFTHSWLGYFFNFQPSGWNAFRESLWDTFFLGGSKYNKNLWTMTVELPGSFLVYAFLAMFGALRGRIVFYMAGTAIMLLSSKLFMLDFLVGMMIADLYAMNERRTRPFYIPALLALPLALASFYVVFMKPVTGQYTLWGMAALDKSTIYEALGGTLLITTTAFSQSLRWFFERRVFGFLGKISFSLYLLHLILICSLASFAYLQLRQQYGLGHNKAAAISCLTCIIVSMAGAWLMYLVVDKPTVGVSRFMYERFFKRREAIAGKIEAPAKPEQLAKAA